MKLVELDAWYKDYENTLDSLRLISWATLAHAEKLAVYNGWRRDVAAEESIQHRAAREFHAQVSVIHYFKTHKLNHESGDYRPLYKRILSALGYYQFDNLTSIQGRPLFDRR